MSAITVVRGTQGPRRLVHINDPQYGRSAMTLCGSFLMTGVQKAGYIHHVTCLRCLRAVVRGAEVEDRRTEHEQSEELRMAQSAARVALMSREGR